ncbi:MAG: hypothetical protein JW715_14330 [Sedimentisphaerales bacterium]|nr:hypothetical protein [Sedimentisphaerales bacterium]
MESKEKEKVNGMPDGAAIISGIEADALAEERQIISEAEKHAAEKKDYTNKKIESMLKDAGKEGREQAEAVKKKIISNVQLEIKRRSMNIRGAVMRDIIERVEKKLDSMSGDSNYRTILIDWIIEACIGLDSESALINTSENERKLIDEQLISEVTGRFHAKTGRKITLQLSQAPPLKSQGVVLTAADGRTAFNNQVRTRMLRKEREIRMAIYNTLFTDDRKE